MIAIRPLEESDEQKLEASIARDNYHKDTKLEFFKKSGTICNVYEDAAGTILYLRGSKALRIDVQFEDNHDIKRNMAAMMEGMPRLAELASSNGFTEIIFNTSNPLLKKFCTRRLGMEEVEGDELRLYL